MLTRGKQMSEKKPVPVVLTYILLKKTVIGKSGWNLW